MLYKNWLHTGSLNIKTPYCPPLKEHIKTECLVIGGGFAGLHAALRLIDGGKQVVLIEKRICGGGSSGQSAGFLTPESEEDIAQLISTYGEKKAKIVYNIPKEGVEIIVNTAKKHSFNCDLRKQDSLYLSAKKSHDKWVREEARIREEKGSPYQLYNRKSLQKIHPGKEYTMGLKYPGSYGINSFAYCQEMKNLLLKKGVKIYEDSEVDKIEGNTAKLHLGSVTAKNILICIDKMKTEFDEDISKKLYHIQTYLAISEPLSDKEMKSLFPKGELMCWDTSLLYIHYRPVIGNRLIVGGSSPWATYYPKDIHSPRIIEKFIDKLKNGFPEIKNIHFTNYWSGLIDVTPDLIPIVDYDQKNKSVQYAMGCAGLNWAAYCGDYIARRMLNPKSTEDLSEFTKMDRKFLFSPWIQKILGKRISFALSHLHKYFGT
ncbi:MAG: FAD-dependent oxidoreductase [Nanoarchaeota archaeon]